MTQPGERSPNLPEPPSAGARRRPHSPAAPLFVWLVLQMAVLVLAAQRVPLSARFPLEAEKLAVHEMLVVQIAPSAMLFPWLLRDRITTLLVALSAILFVHLAAHLAGVPHTRAAVAAAYVAGWLIGLALWRPVLEHGRARMIGVAIATSLSIGGAVLAYLRAETSPTTTPHSFGPILGALAQLDGTAGVRSWAFLIAFLATSLVASLITRRATRAIA